MAEVPEKALMINFKGYPESTGQNAIGLVRKLNTLAEFYGTKIIVTPHPSDLRQVCDVAGNEGLDNVLVFSQDVELPKDEGKPNNITGKITPEFLQRIGVAGVIINHSENRIEKPDGEADEGRIGLLTKALRKRDLVSLVCAGRFIGKDKPEENKRLTMQEVEKLVRVANPDILAVEPPEMIGGDISVTTRPDLIEEFVEKVGRLNPRVKVAVGAGVKNKADAEKAAELNAPRLLVASGVTTPKGKTQVEAAEELLQGLGYKKKQRLNTGLNLDDALRIIEAEEAGKKFRESSKLIRKEKL